MTTNRFKGYAPLTTLALVSLVVQIPFLNRGISFYDEGSILAIADGLRHGEALYRDRVTLLPPLTYELMRVLFDLFGPSLLVGRILQAIVFTLCTLLVHAILRDFVAPRWAVFGALAFLPVKALAFPFWTVVNYSQIAMLFWLAAVLALLRFLPAHRLRWLAAAGCGVGLTLITKQNLGVFLGVTLAAVVAVDALRDGEQFVRRLITRAAVMLGGALPPLALVVLVYARRGTLVDLIDRVVVGLLYVRQLPIVSVPWIYGSGDFGSVVLTYFPAAMFHLAFEHHFPVLMAPVFLLLGFAVKAVYFAPLLALAAGFVLLWRGLRARRSRAEWSALVLIVVFAATAYASMLYRADWTHLMNVLPPLLILCVVMLERCAAHVRWGIRAAIGAGALWLAFGIMATAAVFVAYQVPVDTPRGRLFVPFFEADSTRRLLAYLDDQPREARIVFLRSEPLFYFLSGRRIPILFDLVMPALLSPGDDARISGELAAVDQVIYNPKVLNSLPNPITEYAPETARTLSSNFHLTQVISPTALALKPWRAPAPSDVTVVDLWDNFGDLRLEWRSAPQLAPQPADPPHRAERISWMMYRVVASIVYERDVWSCFAVSHTVRSGEAIATTPMLDPLTWAPTPGDPGFKPETTGAAFEIAIGEPSTAGETVYTGERALGTPPEPIRVPLDAFAGRQVEIRFCAAAAPGSRPGPVYAPAGWAEPRIVRAAHDDAPR